MINKFNPAGQIQSGPSKGEDWIPATLKRVKRPSVRHHVTRFIQSEFISKVKSQIAGLERLKESPREGRSQMSGDMSGYVGQKSHRGARDHYNERSYYEH